MTDEVKALIKEQAEEWGYEFNYAEMSDALC